jgi:hypothetical protein
MYYTFINCCNDRKKGTKRRKEERERKRMGNKRKRGDII